MVYGERFNSISRLVGASLATLGAVLLVVIAARMGDPWKIVSFNIYGAMLTSLYVASTLYHSLRGRAKAIWQKFDHCCIYLLMGCLSSRRCGLPLPPAVLHGWRRGDYFIPWASFFMWPTSAFAMATGFGICLCWGAAAATSSPCSFLSPEIPSPLPRYLP